MSHSHIVGLSHRTPGSESRSGGNLEKQFFAPSKHGEMLHICCDLLLFGKKGLTVCSCLWFHLISYCTEISDGPYMKSFTGMCLGQGRRRKRWEEAGRRGDVRITNHLGCCNSQQGCLREILSFPAVGESRCEDCGLPVVWKYGHFTRGWVQLWLPLLTSRITRED